VKWSFKLSDTFLKQKREALAKRTIAREKVQWQHSNVCVVQTRGNWLQEQFSICEKLLIADRYRQPGNLEGWALAVDSYRSLEYYSLLRKDIDFGCVRTCAGYYVTRSADNLRNFCYSSTLAVKTKETVYANEKSKAESNSAIVLHSAGCRLVICEDSRKRRGQNKLPNLNVS